MKKVLIIAEAGVNHNGDMNVAKKMIDVAAEVGVDFIKFQTFKSKNLVSRFAEKAEYQKESTNAHESQLAMLEKLELTEESHYMLLDYCKQKGVKFLSSPFDLESVDFLRKLGIEYFKIPSGEITNYPYLVKIAQCNIPTIMSTGMAEMKEVHEAVTVLLSSGLKKENLKILHCNTEYPTPMSDVNLLAMNTMGKEFGVTIGYSDHTNGIVIPIAAVALGAEIIEKHFTLDKNMIGPDHKASLDPQELKDMVLAIRDVEVALGNGVKEPSPSEKKNKAIARKSIVALTDIKKGDKFTEANITVKRPGTGISPMSWKDVIGKKSNRDFKPDEIIEL